MGKKLFFFDVDGTLIDNETKIVPQSALDAIRALRKAGHLVFLNSGRTLCFLEYEMETFGVTSAGSLLMALLCLPLCLLRGGFPVKFHVGIHSTLSYRRRRH